MKRRKFILTSVLAAPLAGLARWTDIILNREGGKAFIVRKNQSRFFGNPSAASLPYGRCIISSADTANQIYISAAGTESYAKKGGPGLHIHYQDDEIFYVASGEFLFQLEDEVFLGKAGDTIFAPRGMAHTFANPVANNPGELLIIHNPITPSLEKFYEVFARVGYMSQQMLRENVPAEVLDDLMKTNAFVSPPIDVDAALERLKGK